MHARTSEFFPTLNNPHNIFIICTLYVIPMYKIFNCRSPITTIQQFLRKRVTKIHTSELTNFCVYIIGKILASKTILYICFSQVRVDKNPYNVVTAVYWIDSTGRHLIIKDY